MTVLRAFCGAIIAFTVVVVALGMTADGARSAEVERRFELLHLWATDAEQNALMQIRRPMEEEGVQWLEHFVKTNFRGVKTALAERLAMNIPPAGVGWIADVNLSKLVDSGVFQLIPGKVGDQLYSEILISQIYEVVRHRDGISSVPIGLHVQNNAIYNKEIFAEVGREIPKTWEQFLISAELIKKAGYVPFSTSSEAWQMRPLIVSILNQYLSVEEFKDLFRISPDWDILAPKLLKALVTLEKLRPFANEDNHNLSWEASVLKVRDGIAAANFLGDFNSPMIDKNPDIICAPPPGNKSVVWAFDTIALSNSSDPKVIAGQEAFKEVLARPEVNSGYVREKGGLPVYKGADVASLNRCSRATYNRWQNAAHRFHLGGSTWARHLNIIAFSARALWSNPSARPEEVLTEIEKAMLATGDNQ